MKKLRITVDIEIDTEICKENGISETDLIHNIVSFPDDAMDGVVIMQNFTDEIILGNPTIKDVDLITVI